MSFERVLGREDLLSCPDLDVVTVLDGVLAGECRRGAPRRGLVG
jgi:hypothetical protein